MKVSNIMRWALVALLGLTGLAHTHGLVRQAPVEFGSPAAPPSRMEADGTIVEDWGRLAFTIAGEGIPATGPVAVEASRIANVVPAAAAKAKRGPLEITTTAFRSPTYPAGTDVVTLQIKNTSAAPVSAKLGVPLPDGARVGKRTVIWGGRIILTLPMPIEVDAKKRAWGCDDDSTPMPGWGRPDVECDPAFRNIRAGMNGVPIVYKFSVTPGSSHDVVLGLCESHWESSGMRPVVLKVEGAPPVTVDPLARWGRHKPGALAFQAKDENGDGTLVVSALPAPGAPDPNPILNVIWLFPAGTNPNLDQVILGRMNAVATRTVDVGGETDQSLYLPGKAEYSLSIPAGGTTELTFFVGAAGGSAPMPGKSGWTLETLRKAAVEVNRDWKER
ncbi:MAG: hypothetical protein GX446_09410 [Chthonomonadales bacterium]|nr:hypothetical protein [Chthonomonadales bacterium]